MFFYKFAKRVSAARKNCSIFPMCTHEDIILHLHGVLYQCNIQRLQKY